jgi:hypothetical protein
LTESAGEGVAARVAARTLGFLLGRATGASGAEAALGGIRSSVPRALPPAVLTDTCGPSLASATGDAAYTCVGPTLGGTARARSLLPTPTAITNSTRQATQKTSAIWVRRWRRYQEPPVLPLVW